MRRRDRVTRSPFEKKEEEENTESTSPIIIHTHSFRRLMNCLVQIPALLLSLSLARYIPRAQVRVIHDNGYLHTQLIPK